MSTRRAVTRPEHAETWDFSAVCNDCRQELGAIIEELVFLGALEIVVDQWPISFRVNDEKTKAASR